MSDVRLYEGVETHTGTCSNCGNRIKQRVGVYRDGTKGRQRRVVHTNPHGTSTFQCSLYATGTLKLNRTEWFDTQPEPADTQ